MTARFEFETKEETNAFLHLLNCLPRAEKWIQANFVPDETCHICKGEEYVKRGLVPYYGLQLEAYTFWNCCLYCHSKGWEVPTNTDKEKITYWREQVPGGETDQLAITDIKLFKYPSISVDNTNILVSI